MRSRKVKDLKFLAAVSQSSFYTLVQYTLVQYTLGRYRYFSEGVLLELAKSPVNRSAITRYNPL